MAETNPKIHIGTSGYQYNHWKGVFYPEDMPVEKWFEYYSHHFDTVEINNTFYNLPSQDKFKKWKEAAPSGFNNDAEGWAVRNALRLKDICSSAKRKLDLIEMVLTM